jgi:RNA polymerase sigma-70 factor (ECF subfamily)
MLAFYLSMMDNDDERSLFVDLYNEFYEVSLFYADKLLKNTVHAEDAVHEAFLDVIKNRKKHLTLPHCDFRRVFAVIVRFKAIDILRKQGRETLLDNVNDALDDKPSTEELAIRKITVHEMSIHLDRISEISRQVLFMKYICDMSYKNIAKELNMTEKNVEVRIARAKRKVREMMAKGDEINE